MARQATMLISLVALMALGIQAMDASNPDVMAILNNGKQFTTFLRLLNDTHVGEQIQSYLIDTYAGFTLFAPTDNAFHSLQAGTLNSYAPPELADVLLYHFIVLYYTQTNLFRSAGTTLYTLASGRYGIYTVNITGTGSAVFVSSGKIATQLRSALYSSFPLAVYPIEQVLLPQTYYESMPKYNVVPEPVPAPHATDQNHKHKKAPAPAPSTAAGGKHNHKTAPAPGPNAPPVPHAATGGKAATPAPAATAAAGRVCVPGGWRFVSLAGLTGAIMRLRW